MKKLIVLTILLASAGFYLASATAGTLPTATMPNTYAQFLETKLAHCQAKQAYEGSKMASMRRTAVRAALKAEFLETEKAALMVHLQEHSIVPGTAKAEHFLNARFEDFQQALRAHYTHYLTTRIAQCKAKLGYGRSKWDSMRRKATFSALKANFLETHLEELVAQMLEAHLGRQTAKLDHFINAEFNAFVHPELLAYLTGN